MTQGSAQTLGGPYFKMSDDNVTTSIKFELKSNIENVLSKLNSDLHRMINVEPGTESQDVNIESQDVNIDDNASANTECVLSRLQSKLHEVILVEPRTYIRKKDKLYKERVMSKIGNADTKKVVMNLGGHYLHEHMFVECFKPDGWMSNFVVSCLTNLWNKEWGDKTIISQQAVQELLGDKGDKLAEELNKEVLGRTKLIFIPIQAGDHWNLAVLDLIEKKNV